MKGVVARAGCAMSGVTGATIGVAGGMMGRAELGGAAVEALATAVREMLSRRIDGGALSALISEPWPSPRWRGVSSMAKNFFPAKRPRWWYLKRALHAQRQRYDRDSIE